MSPKNHKELLFKKFDNFESEFDEIKKKLLRFEIENLLRENEDFLDAEDFYIWGLIYYFTDDDKEWNLEKSLEKFTSSLEVDAQYNMARLYLAHCFQDKNELDKALENYLLVNQNEIRSEFAIWRYVKLHEQIGYCYFKLGDEEMGLKYFQNAIRYYEKLPSDELVNPSEMISCLPENHIFIMKLRETGNYFAP